MDPASKEELAMGSSEVDVDKDDEIEELHESLKEVVQDQSVKPKLQCLMVDPSFSMVTVQSEDSGIVWETASSRCSTPWASEGSSPSEQCSLEGSGTQGNIVIIMEEDKIRRKKSSRRRNIGGGIQNSRSRLAISRVGEQRPAMAEVSLPNIRSEADEENLSHGSKDRDLFSLISEGFEILNIVVPSKLATVDEEDCTEMAENLSYLDSTPKIKSNHVHYGPVDQGNTETNNQEVKESESFNNSSHTPPDEKEEAHMDYLEKFTLLDEQAPIEGTSVIEDVEQDGALLLEDPQLSQKEAKADDGVDDESFVIISDLEIADEHLDEVFYGTKSNAEPESLHEDKDEATRKESLKSLKKSGSILFGSQECILTPVYLPTGPPKIIDQVLLEEPRAMSFHYSDLYEEALGDQRREDDCSDTESIISERSFKRRYSDSDDADGYLEKFTLKDKAPADDKVLQPKEEHNGKLEWSQNKFMLTGCLTSTMEEETIEEDKKAEIVPKEEQSKTEDEGDSQSTGCCSPGHCSAETSPTVRGMNVPEKMAKIAALKTEEMSDVVIIKDGVENSSESNTSVQEVNPILDLKTKEKDEEQLVEHLQITDGNYLSESLEAEDVSFEIVNLKVQTDEIQAPESVSEFPEERFAMVDIVDCGISEKPKEDDDQVKMPLSLPETHLSTKADEDTLQLVHKDSTETSQKNMGLKFSTLSNEQPNADQSLPLELDKELKTETKTTLRDAHEIRSFSANNSELHEKELLCVAEEEEEEASGTASKEEKPEEPNQKNPTNVQSTCERVTAELLTKSFIKPESKSALKSDLQETKALSTEIQIKPEIDISEIETAYDIDKQDIDKTPTKDESVPAEEELVVKVHKEKNDDIAAVESKTMKNVEDTEKSGSSTDIQLEGPDEAAKTDLPIKEDSDETRSLENRVTTATTADSVAAERVDVRDEEEIAVSLKAPGGECDVTTSQMSLDNEVPMTDGTDVEERMSPANDLKEIKKHTDDRDTEEKVDLLVLISPPSHVGDDDPTTMRVSPLETEETDDVKDNKMENQIRSNGELSQLRSFTPQENLSLIRCDPDLQHKVLEELDYEIVTKEEARELEQETLAEHGSEESPGAGFELVEDSDFVLVPEEPVEVSPMDAFCLACQCPVLLSDSEHRNHEMASLEEASASVKKNLADLISAMQKQSEDIENFVSELELAYNTVEENFMDCEKIIKRHNEEAVKLVLDQYNEMSQAMEDEKKAKLEQLYDQIVSSQENIDQAKETMEETAKEEEEMDETNPLKFISSSKDISKRLNTALEFTLSLELGPRGLLVFENYAKGKSGKKRKDIPVPQKPHLQPQEANSANSSSVTVYWRVSADDVIDCFQVYCMEEPQGTVSEEYRVTVKESYCNLEELEADKCYKVWVMAVNYTGCSMPSDRLAFKTAPSVPVIQTEKCTVLWDSATLRWSSVHPGSVESYTLEYCRQYACEREGLRSISGIKGCEQMILLQPNENYLFYIKSVNAAGSSEQSEAALISTRGTRFPFLTETANPVLKVSEHRDLVEYPHETYSKMSSVIECPFVLGELLPSVGRFYWETEVSKCKAYRIGIACHTVCQASTLGENSASWCLHCVPTSISCRFELLHDRVHSDIFVTDTPVRIGTVLDYSQGQLIFFNATTGQLLGSFQQAFTGPCHPVFALEQPGSLELRTTMEVPEFVKHS